MHNDIKEILLTKQEIDMMVHRIASSVNDDFYDLMLAINKDTGNRRIVDAVIRAKAMHERKVADGAETQESVTTIYELLIALGAIKVIEDEDGTRYELNLK